MKSITISFICTDGMDRIHSKYWLLNLKERGQLKDLDVGISLSWGRSRSLWNRMSTSKEMTWKLQFNFFYIPSFYIFSFSFFPLFRSYFPFLFSSSLLFFPCSFYFFFFFNYFLFFSFSIFVSSSFFFFKFLKHIFVGSGSERDSPEW
jgi:hypothetical protein